MSQLPSIGFESAAKWQAIGAEADRTAESAAQISASNISDPEAAARIAAINGITDPVQLGDFAPTLRMSGDAGVGRVLLLSGAAGLVAVPAAATYFLGRYNGSENTPEKKIGVTGTTLTTPEGLSGTVKDGSDAAIMEDVESGLTNCGGIKGELWIGKPYNPSHMFDFYTANPDMVNATQTKWTDVMGAAPLQFLTEKALANNDADHARKLSGNDLMTTFTQKLIANTGVPEGTLEANHNCVDTNSDGKADTIQFLDFRVARHGNKTQEGEKRTTLAGHVLHKADFEQFVKLMQDAGKDPTQLISYEIDLDLNSDGKIAEEERFVFVAASSAICENLVLRAELPPTVTVVSNPPGTPPVVVTVTTRSGGTTTIPNVIIPPTTAPPSTRVEVAPPAPAPVQGPGLGSEADQDDNGSNNATTSTTTTAPTGTTILAGGPPTSTPVPPTTATTVLPG